MNQEGTCVIVNVGLLGRANLARKEDAFKDVDHFLDFQALKEHNQWAERRKNLAGLSNLRSYQMYYNTNCGYAFCSVCFPERREIPTIDLTK